MKVNYVKKAGLCFLLVLLSCWDESLTSEKKKLKRLKNPIFKQQKMIPDQKSIGVIPH